MKGYVAIIAAIGICFCLFAPAQSQAGEIDILLEKLVEKGVLNAGEAQQIKYETQEQVKKEVASGKSASLPAWVQNIKLKGDLRLRYQYLHSKSSSGRTPDTHIGRIRARLGLEGKVNEKLMAGIGIATNRGGDPRSTNITFGRENSGYSSKWPILLDYAYAKYTPWNWLTLVGGKMLLSDVLWEAADLIWDTDITPEGAAIRLSKEIDPKLSVFMNSAVLVMDDDTSTDESSPTTFLVQPGMSYKFNDNISLRGAFAYYNFSGISQSTAPGWSGGANTRRGPGNTKWAYGYRVINPGLEIGIKEPLKALGIDLESLKLFGEYVNNTAVSDKNSGFALGFQFGNNRVAKWGDWQLKYIYAMLERDAVLDVLPDSDRWGGKTGMRSHEGILTFGLSKNTSLGVDIYRSWNINNVSGANPRAPETLVQIDWNMRF